MHETTLDWCKWNFQNGFFPESSIDILVELSSYLIASKFGKMQMEFVSSAHLELSIHIFVVFYTLSNCCLAQIGVYVNFSTGNVRCPCPFFYFLCTHIHVAGDLSYALLFLCNMLMRYCDYTFCFFFWNPISCCHFVGFIKRTAGKRIYIYIYFFFLEYFE